MGFGINNKQIAVLESRFQFYENLSKEMLHKLERAVDKITESNHTVAIILERHENRLDNAAQANTLIIKMIDEIQNSVNKKISTVEKKIEDVSRIKWIIVGVGIASSILATSISTLASGWWNPGEMGYRIQHQYVPTEEPKK
jgi:Zn-dependent M16 (insulinase) family peptidase